MTISDPKTVGRRQAQWILIAAWVMAFGVLGFMDIQHWEQKGRTPWGCAMGIITAFAHGEWITLDLKVLNRPVGAWRFAAFFLGPLIVWLHLAYSYRVRAVWMIPISLIIYAAPVGFAVLAILLMGGLAPVWR